MARAAALLCAIGAAASAASSDSEALVQQFVATHTAPSSQAKLVDRLVADHNITVKQLMSLVQKQRLIINEPEMKASLTEFAKVGSSALDTHKSGILRGWKEFQRHAMSSIDPRPEELLRKAKMALIQTGAMAEMRKVALKTREASKATTRGGVPLDSMVIGFYTSLAPWNNVLKQFSIPLIKASFSMFTNLFGPEGNAARLCVSAGIAADSTYYVHERSEFGGIGVSVGPAKWDNVPGWKFGASGGIDNIRVFDVADFGWDWTLEDSPETVGFHYDVQLVDHEQMVMSTMSALQQEATVETDPPDHFATHGSTSISHVWCSPDWEDTPLVLSPRDRGTRSASRQEPSTGAVEYDPVDDAV